MNKVLIERKGHVAIYAQVIDKNGKLGKYEVYSDFNRSSGIEYAHLSDAQDRMKFLIGVKSI